MFPMGGAVLTHHCYLYHQIAKAPVVLPIDYARKPIMYLPIDSEESNGDFSHIFSIK